MNARVAAALAAALLLGGCAAERQHPAAPPPETGQPFLPVLLHDLQTGQRPPDTSCRQLLLPCDRPSNGPGGPT